MRYITKDDYKKTFGIAQIMWDCIGTVFTSCITLIGLSLVLCFWIAQIK